ncbi:multifunctional procollagen lysine hydroxylase and glycosyltransferase LH3 [Folsomia candida]|uniref:multifunctional procollagen lysine hydroxylase and glycosyltransferase LH3 n=1 Tax=Folsomia candida TaxID=158441 RepID=UPI001604CF22|nr:multifunctional procollagen lysine hydroxylase and glycosyltransferase LH3 [Folsomia candida]
MLIRPYSGWSNFWGAINHDGYYARSKDYVSIVKRNVTGVWKVPFLSGAYLMSYDIFRNSTLRPKYTNNFLIPELAFCLNNRIRNIPMFVSNVVEFGHLINSDNFDITRIHAELYELFDNRYDWEKRYLHADWSSVLNVNQSLVEIMKNPETMPCPDVFWVPLVTPSFCEELIDEMEVYGKWFMGLNYDHRAEGGATEDAPTVDIHLYEIGFGDVWLEFLRLYVVPLQVKLFMDNLPYPPIAKMNFVVRYKPDEQAYLKPHHDKSTYTVNIALNKGGGIDFEGGGCRFTRYNCSIDHSKVGHALIHPGKLTHEHEGLSILSGTRYILVSFVDP